MTIVELVVIILGLLFGAGATVWLTRKFDLRRPNFRGERIPALAGLVFVLAAEWVYAYEWLSNTLDPKPAAALFLVVLGFGALGLLDDIRGGRGEGGYRGHFLALQRGRLTTGAAKALGGGIVSLAAAYLLSSPSPGRVLVGALLIALAANTLNLLDLRPGRCLFGFFLGAAALALTLAWHHAAGVGFLLYVAAAFALMLYPLDARGKAMLGDTGANALGAVLGTCGVLYFSLLWQGVVVVLLLTFQLWSEGHSLSRTIESNALLRRLDRKIGVR